MIAQVVFFTELCPGKDRIKVLFMYRFILIAVGRIKNKALASLCNDFTKRIKRYGKFEQFELKDSDVETEGKRIVEALSKHKNARIYVLAEEGTCYNSTAFAREIFKLQGQPAIFVLVAVTLDNARVDPRACG